MKNVYEIKIDKDIPIIARGRDKKIKKASIYPFDKLEVGHSFFVPKKIKSHKTMAAVNGYYARLLKPKKFTRRALLGGTRIWRIA